MKKFTFSFFFYIIFSVLLFSQPTHKVDLQKLDQYFEQVVTDWNIPGMTVGIVKDGEMIFGKGYGVLEVGKNEKPDEHTLYAIASNTKAFTSAVIATLVQEGTLSWNDKVQDHLPYFEVYDPYISQLVSVRDLLCHRVGLGTFSGDIIWYNTELKAEEIIQRIKGLPKAYEFRNGYGYSNVMYITAGELIRKVTGKSWGENVQERILDPLGMDRTIYRPQYLDSKGNYATPHALEEGKNIPIAWTDWEQIAATGGLISSIHDVSKWMIFNLNHGIWGKDTLLSKSSRNLIWTPHNNFTVDHTKDNDFGTNFAGYGLGWGLRDYHGTLRVSHTGGYDGMITAVNLLPDEGLGVVVLTNGMKSPISAVSYYVMDAFLGREAVDWSAKLLERTNKRIEKDTRIQDRKDARVVDTKPSLSQEACIGNYKSDIYGLIEIYEEKGDLRVKFEHTPFLDATLKHWHYDTWKLDWDEQHAWFSFGTIQFEKDNNQKVTGLKFDVPNNDFFFEELKPYRVK